MLIDGEKWACEACVRGHRVSSCHHSDRPLTHINKKGRPVSQCAHCRGLRKSRTTHTKCECGDKKKSHKHDSDPHFFDRRDLKQDFHAKCGCCHGQRCTCALKKEPHLDPVPETGLPPPPHSVLSEPPKKPQLTSTKSESTLTIFRDGHHKPAHKHNDMAHKCGLPYTIPRSHTIHATSDVARRSVDQLPLSQAALMGDTFSSHPIFDHAPDGLPRRVKSEHGSPESAPIMPADDPTVVPPLDLSSFFPPAAPSLDHTPSDGHPSEPPRVSMGKSSVDPIVTSVPPLDVSPYSTFPNSNPSPVNCLPFQDPYKDPYFTSPDTEVPQHSTAFSAPPVDWSSFPLYSSDVPAPSTQAPSYASFDYNSMGPNFAAPSSSGDISEVEDFAPLPGLGTAGSELHSASESSDIDQYRISSASSYNGLPQVQLLSSNQLESINIDDFLKSANESTAALEHQLQANLGMDGKALSQEPYELAEAPGFKPMETPAGLPITTSPTDPVWAAGLFEPGPPPLDENNANDDRGYFSSWGQ
ncbi:copper fist DNA binding domain protein [Aspergillus campestris IBT 28561]|uniref:Copper fist DNA binding domain protein n=1 Tax=Aspergillus campestris (strain IBT 28561) TaxID=1392248 RepID=A0A2I1CZX0_ASPC2|nr:copper fist DNA binding domain protein [Aspergillus campestris IBT 28561]PKY03174.1 copper fist DNA binding domain protein [Aspergillus campestris IBT 28561]